MITKRFLYLVAYLLGVQGVIVGSTYEEKEGLKFPNYPLVTSTSLISHSVARLFSSIRVYVNYVLEYFENFQYSHSALLL